MKIDTVHVAGQL